MRNIRAFAVLALAFSLPALAAQSRDAEIFKRLNTHDQALLRDHAILDADARKIWAQVDRGIPVPAARRAGAYDDGCIDSCVASCQGGAGSQACWSQCGTEGNSSAVCAPRCGITTALGSQACWNKCGVEGYSSAVCADRCGTTTGLGSQACWTKCNVEGYSSSVCAPRCGTATAEGAQACWQKCNLEGYSSDVCAKRCGTN
jgi:hypothetical protein